MKTFACRLLTSGIFQPRAREALLDPVDDRLIDLHLQPERLRQRLARHVILGRPEAAGGDEDVRVAERVADLVDELAQACRRRRSCAPAAMPNVSSAAVTLSEFVSTRVGPSISEPMAMMEAAMGCRVAGLLSC